MMMQEKSVVEVHRVGMLYQTKIIVYQGFL